jgi:hypothetical protein
MLFVSGGKKLVKVYLRKEILEQVFYFYAKMYVLQEEQQDGIPTNSPRYQVVVMEPAYFCQP